MNVLQLPVTASRNRDIRSALEVADRALHELLRKAVGSYRSGETRAAGSFGHRHHLAIAQTYLDSVAIILDKDGVATELQQCLDIGIFDIRRLAGIAREWDDNPPPPLLAA